MPCGNTVAVNFDIRSRRPRSLTLPRIDNDDAGAVEISHVSRDHGYIVNECCGSDQSIRLVASVGNMQMRAARRDGVIDRQYPTGELRSHMVIKPCPQA